MNKKAWTDISVIALFLPNSVSEISSRVFGILFRVSCLTDTRITMAIEVIPINIVASSCILALILIFLALQWR